MVIQSFREASVLLWSKQLIQPSYLSISSAKTVKLRETLIESNCSAYNQ